MNRSRIRLAAGLAAGAVLLASCGGGGGSGDDGDLVVVGTVNPIVDLIRKVGGDRVTVSSIVPAGRNTHDYSPRPSDARTLTDADLFIDNGLGLNETLLDFALNNLPDDAQTMLLGNELPGDTRLATGDGTCHEGHCHGTVNAHTWPDTLVAQRYAELIADALTAVDRDGEDVYRANAKTLADRLGRLHEAIAAATATVPEQNRKLVVYHDAWAYFARRYGFRMIGALQAVNLAEPSAGEVRAMVDQIKAEAVPAFFGSEVFPSDVMGAVAEESGAKHVPGLSDDTLPGKPGEPEHSYVGLMLANTRLIVSSLGGDSTALDEFEQGETS